MFGQAVSSQEYWGGEVFSRLYADLLFEMLMGKYTKCRVNAQQLFNKMLREEVEF